jgi:hypothetical protein
MNTNIVEELTKVTDDFESKYGLALTLKANLAAINVMMVKHGRGEELLENIKKVIENFEKKQAQEVAKP